MIPKAIILPALVLATLLAACDKTPAPDRSAAGSAGGSLPAATTVPAQPAASAKAASRSPVPSFSVQVTLSDAASRQFAKSGESVVVAAAYSGAPRPGVDGHELDDVGQVDLGRVEKELPGAGSVTFNGNAIPQDKLRLVAGAPQVNINVYSGRHSSEDNLLDCDFFQDAIAIAANKPIQIHCRLLTERSSGQP